MQLVYRALAHLLPHLPRALVRRVAQRYIAGETMDDAIVVARQFEAAGLATTIDLLGENQESESEIEAAVEEYLRLLDRLRSERIDRSQVSVKPTLLGLRLDEDLAAKNLLRLVEKAAADGFTVCIDMEDSSTTDATLRLFRTLRAAHENVWIAIQAALRRSRDDVDSLAPLRPWVRLCKGIYRERPDIAFQGRDEIRANFLALARLLIERGGFPALATHDPWLLDRSLQLVESARLGAERYEFEMLLGVGEESRARILATGARLRIYCPYGPEWRAYSLRRLRENPQIVGYVLRSVLRAPGRRAGAGRWSPKTTQVADRE